MESPTIYTANIDGQTYEGKATIIKKDNLRIVRNQLSLEKTQRTERNRASAYFKLKETLTTLLKKRYSNQDNTPKELFDLLLKQENNQLLLLNEKIKFLKTFLETIKGKSSSTLTENEKKDILNIKKTFKDVPNTIINTTLKLSTLYKEQIKSFDFLEKTELDKLDKIIVAYMTITSDISTMLATMPSVRFGGKRKTLDNTTKKDKKLAIVHKKVKTMKYKQL